MMRETKKLENTEVCITSVVGDVLSIIIDVDIIINTYNYLIIIYLL